MKELREDFNVSQYTLADILKVGQDSISRWENGNREPDMDTIVQIAAYFGTSIDYLMGRTSEKSDLNKKTPKNDVSGAYDAPTKKATG